MTLFSLPPVHFARRAALPLALLLALPGCSLLSSSKPAPGHSAYQAEQFQPNENFSRLFDANAETTCEAARRALLSQGYVITQAKPASINGQKSFQPDGDTHLEITFTIVCVPDGRDKNIATAYVTAQQDRYAVKKSSSATSVGVSAIGSISLPLSSTQDSMVKVGSETILASTFYDRFFGLVSREVKDLH
ncbi:MAG: DUF2242 domain-containing protein [Curvibacter sp.]|nr:MAG: DUF2242 domain-containing protein [Curvibacter sp.]